MEKSKFYHAFVSLLILGCSSCFIACNDDDDPPPSPIDGPDIKQVNGDYKGKMYITPIDIPVTAEEGEEPAGIEIAATVKNDTVYFDDFPIESLVKSIIEDEEQAEGIIEAIGKVKYKIGFDGTLNAAKDTIVIEYDPKPLELIIPIDETTNMTVKVTTSTDSKKGSYAFETNNMKFAIKTDKVEVDEVSITDFPLPIFSFELNNGK